MVYFQTKNPNWGKFWRALYWKMLIYIIAIWNILRILGIFYDHLVHFVFIWHIFFCFWYHAPLRNLAILIRSIQGDQIGRIFGLLGEFLLWVVFLKITEVAQILAYFFRGKSLALILTKMVSASFWIMLSNVHLVTLDPFPKICRRPFSPFLMQTKTKAKQAFQVRVARFFLIQTYQNGKNIPNDHKLYQTTIKYTKRP
jgi:signal transduction histidine kinase